MNKSLHTIGSSGLTAIPALAFAMGAILGAVEAGLLWLRYPGLAPVGWLQTLVSASFVGTVVAIVSLPPAFLVRGFGRDRSNAWQIGTTLAALASGSAVVMFLVSFRSTIVFRHLPGDAAGRVIAQLIIVLIGIGLFLALAPRLHRALEHRVNRLGKQARTLLGVEIGMLIATLGCVSIFGSAHRKSEPASPDHPNVILISVDTLRADHLSCYGYERQTSPHIDGLAERGVRFDHAVTTWPSSAPGHASMLSGLYPPTHGVMGNGFQLSGIVPTLGEAAQQAGMRSAGFVNNPWLTYTLGFAQGFETYFDAERVEVAGEGWLGLLVENISIYRLGAKLIFGERQPATELAMSWIDRVGDERFFLFLHLLDPHQPYQPDPEFEDIFLAGSGGTDPGDTRIYMGKAAGHKSGMGRNTGEEVAISPEIETGIVARYDECVANADARLGALFGFLERRGLADRTVILLTSDHGENMADHAPRFHHEGLNEATLRVPFILAGPGTDRAQPNRNHVVSLVDIFPTLAALGGLAPPPFLAGHDLTQPITEDRALLSLETPAKEFTRVAVSTRDWKLVQHRDADLVGVEPLSAVDPGDSATVRATLRAQLDSLFEAAFADAYPSEDGTGQLDADRLDQLKALGYLN